MTIWVSDLRSSALVAPFEATIFRENCEVHQPHRFNDLTEVGTNTKARMSLEDLS